MSSVAKESRFAWFQQFQQWKHPGPHQATVNLPAPTAWPIILAFGITLLFAGLLTSASVSILGAILAVTGCVGWFRDVLPHREGGDG